MGEQILALGGKITNIRGHVFGDINIGSGITVVTTKVGTFEIRILKLIDNIGGAGLGPKYLIVVGCGHCTLDVGSREIKLELLYYNSNYYSAAEEITASFKPIVRVEHPLTNPLVDECLETAETPLTRQSATDYLTHLINDLKVVAESVYTLRRVFINKQKQHLESVPAAASTTLKDLANQLLKILKEEEKSI